MAIRSLSLTPSSDLRPATSLCSRATSSKALCMACTGLKSNVAAGSYMKLYLVFISTHESLLALNRIRTRCRQLQLLVRVRLAIRGAGQTIGRGAEYPR